MAQPQTGMIPFFSTDPNIQQASLDAQYRMQLAQALQQQGLTPIDTSNRTVGGVAYHVSPFEGLGKIAQAVAGQYMRKQAITDQSQAMAAALQQATLAMGGGDPTTLPSTLSAPVNDSPQPNPASQALAEGAQNGSVGPTNDNAARMAALLQNGAGTADSAPAQGQTPDAGGPQANAGGARDAFGMTLNPAEAKAGAPAPAAAPMPAPGTPRSTALNPAGIPPSVAAMAYTLDPQKYLENVVSQYGLTDIQKQAIAAGYQPGTPAYQQFMQVYTRKQSFIPPTAIRPGGAILDNTTGQLTTTPAAAPAGYQAVRNADGTWSYRPVQNGLNAVRQSTYAGELGKAELEPTTIYDPSTGEYGFSTRALDAGRAAPGGMPAGGPMNNPGNLRNPGQSIGFAQFSSPQEGLQAIDHQLQLYGSRGINTVSQIVSTWAPPSDGNNTGAYIQHVSQVLGVKPNQPLDMGNPLVRQALSTAIVLHEQGPQRLFAGGAGAAPGPVVPKPPPGAVEAQSTLAQNNAQRLTQTVNQAQDSATRVNVLDNILNLSRSGVLTGPTADFMNKVKGYAASLPGAAAIMSNWRDDVSGYQELSKFLLQNASRNWQAAGGTGTDAQLEAFTKSNPNPTMFPQALQAVAEWSKAGELALQGRAAAMQNYANAGPQNIARLDKFEQLWRQNFDPVLYQLKSMDANQQRAYTEQLQRTNPKAYQALMQKAANLRQMGAY